MERLDLENGLRRALHRNELRVYYQPEMSAADGHVVAVEALVRWEHPERGLLEPADFIPLAEEVGLIGEIGDWGLDTACRLVSVWRARGTTIDDACNGSWQVVIQ